MLFQDEAAARLAEEIYDAGIDPSMWPHAIRTIVEFVGGAAGWLMTRDSTGGTGEVTFGFGDDPYFRWLYTEQYIGADPISAALPSLGYDDVVSGTSIMPRAEFIQTRFYGEWLEPQGWLENLCVVLDRSTPRLTLFTMVRSQGDGWADDGVRQRMQLIAPHLRRSVLVGQALGFRTAQAATLADTLDQISAGVFFIDAEGAIIHANASGSRMLADGVLSANFALAGPSKRTAPRSSRHALASSGESETPEHGECNGEVLALNAPNGDRYIVHGLPLTSGQRRQAGIYQRAVAALFVQRAAIASASAGAAIAQHYKLTPTELRVLLSIAESAGVPAAAAALSIAESTVRTHLSRLFTKTGTNSQIELAALVAKFAGIFSS